MRRTLTILAAVLAAPLAAMAADKVTFRDPKTGKEGSRTGAITKETPEAVEIKTGTATVEVQVRDLLSVQHGDAPAEFLQAEEAEQALDFLAAAELFQKSLSAKGAGPWVQHDARFRRGDCLYRAGNLGEALSSFQEVSDKAAEGRFKFLAQVRQAQCLLFQRKFDDAKALFDRVAASARGREGALAVYWGGRALEHKGDRAGARMLYDDAASRAGSSHPEVRQQAEARKLLCDALSGKAEEVLPGLQALVDEAGAETAGGAAARNALGRIRLSLANAAKDRPEESKKLAFSGLMDFLRVALFAEAHPEEQAPAYEGAEACLALLGDSRSAQFKADRQRYFGESFLLP